MKATTSSVKKALLGKEIRLAMHPTVPLFWVLSAMLLIPNYPYYVIFFYTLLGIFFICLTGRENNDIAYSLTLPVRKRDLVAARMGLAVGIELIQAVLAIPFAILRQRMPLPGNQVGMDANIAFFGLSFLLLGLMNALFFPRYYATPHQVGRAFAWTAVLSGLCIAVLEVLAHALPLFRDQLDTPDPQFLPAKLTCLGLGLLCFGACTWLAYRCAAARFEKLDL